MPGEKTKLFDLNFQCTSVFVSCFYSSVSQNQSVCILRCGQQETRMATQTGWLDCALGGILFLPELNREDSRDKG